VAFKSQIKDLFKKITITIDTEINNSSDQTIRIFRNEVRAARNEILDPLLEMKKQMEEINIIMFFNMLWEKLIQLKITKVR